MGSFMSRCYQRQPSYARYQSDTHYSEPDLENVVGSVLELDPSLQDREEGVTKINSWIEETSPEIMMSPEQLEISRWKCIKYWEAQHVSDIYGAEYSVAGSKLAGSCVRLYFERKHDGTIPRLVIEHCGRSVNIRSAHSHVPAWLRSFQRHRWFPWKRTNSNLAYEENVSLNGSVPVDLCSQ